MRVCTTGCRSAEEEGPGEAGVQEAFMSRKEGRVEGRAGASSFRFWIKAFSGSPSAPTRGACECVHTEVSEGGVPQE